jgi:hypothetical protein
MVKANEFDLRSYQDETNKLYTEDGYASQLPGYTPLFFKGEA